MVSRLRLIVLFVLITICNIQNAKSQPTPPSQSQQEVIDILSVLFTIEEIQSDLFYTRGEKIELMCIVKDSELFDKPLNIVHENKRLIFQEEYDIPLKSIKKWVKFSKFKVTPKEVSMVFSIHNAANKNIVKVEIYLEKQEDNFWKISKKSIKR